jgi:hypothetical protein
MSFSHVIKFSANLLNVFRYLCCITLMLKDLPINYELLECRLYFVLFSFHQAYVSKLCPICLHSFICYFYMY